MNRQHLHAIDVLRGGCSVGVLVWHYQFYFGEQVFPRLLAPLYVNGHVLVDVFFVISGFVLSHVYGERLATWSDFTRYSLARLRRLYPLHVATLLATSAVFWGLKARGLGFGFCYPVNWNDARHFGLNLALLQQVGLQQGYSFNAPAWSISTEFWTSLAFGLGLVTLPRRFRLAVAVVVAVGATLARAHFWYELKIGGWLDIYLLRTVAAFFAGVATYGLWTRRTARSVRWADLLLVLGAVSVFVALICPPTASWRKPAELAAAEVGGSVLVWGAASSQRAQGVARSAWLRWQGEISFSLYLWHFPVAGAFQWAALRQYVVGEDLFVLYIGTVVAVAAVSFRWLERPARRLFGSHLDLPARASGS